MTEKELMPFFQFQFLDKAVKNMFICLIFCLCWFPKAEGQIQKENIYKDVSKRLYNRLLREKIISSLDTLYIVPIDMEFNSKDTGKIAYHFPVSIKGDYVPIYLLHPMEGKKSIKITITFAILQKNKNNLYTSGTLVFVYRKVNSLYRYQMVKENGL